MFESEGGGGMKHELKTWPEYYNAVFDGTKTFEVRKNDRNYQVNDVLYLREWDPLRETYTGSVTKVCVTYILSDPAFVKEGFVIMGISYEGDGRE
jgi:hypothetical protein